MSRPARESTKITQNYFNEVFSRNSDNFIPIYNYVTACPQTKEMSDVLQATGYPIRLSFNNPQFSDFKIRFTQSGKKLYVHRAILSASSAVFSTMLNSGLMESVSSEMEVDEDEDEELLTNLIHSVYCGDILVPSEEKVVAMINLAAKYELELEKDLIVHLSKIVSKQNVATVFELDETRVSTQNLLVTVKDFMKENYCYLGLCLDQFRSFLSDRMGSAWL
jgi:hypothetical protein